MEEPVQSPIYHTVRAPSVVDGPHPQCGSIWRNQQSIVDQLEGSPEGIGIDQYGGLCPKLCYRGSSRDTVWQFDWWTSCNTAGTATGLWLVLFLLTVTLAKFLVVLAFRTCQEKVFAILVLESRNYDN